MHPAGSVIFFTVASGAGYGLLVLLGLGVPLGLLPAGPRFGVAALALAFALITAGLLSSTLHLGHPERAWRAVTQWRTSWLSREGVAALLTYLPAGLFGIGWVVLGRTDGWIGGAGSAAAAMAVGTLWCTAMIYASLRPVHQWANRWVPPNFLALAAMSGALWLNALLHLAGLATAGATILALAATAAAAALKEGYWRFIDATASPATAESATGLGALGTVRLLDPPHTEENYLLKEMGFRIARRHATKLRRLVRGLGFAGPFGLTLVGLAGLPGWAGAAAALLGAVAAMAGILVERWLFFAEAKHTVTLYYGARAA